MNLPDFIREETKKRCKVFAADEKTEKKFGRLSPELFHFLYDAEKIRFNIYVRIETYMIEFMRSEELSKELLDQVWAALNSTDRRVEIMVLNSQRQAFDQIIAEIRAKKIASVVEKDPSLDRKTLDVFSNLSGASQLVVRGGLSDDVVKTVQNSAKYLVSNLMDSEMAIATLSRMVTHDPTLYDHSASVAMISGLIAMQCLNRNDRKEAETLAQCGLYHDVGKTCVPSAILNKPGRFTDDEFAVMKTHAALGEEELGKVIAEGARIEPIAARVAGEHHERFNGKGYPKGRKGRMEEDPKNGIHLFSRIVTIADVYSALLMKRIYKPAYEAQDAIKIMALVAAEEYDPEIFQKFLRNVVTSLNTYQEKAFGKDRGRILQFDETGNLREKKRQVI